MATTDSSNFEKILIALADPTRQELLDLIALRGQATATTLATTITVSRQAVVKHLTILKDARLVSSHRVGREVRYKVSTATFFSSRVDGKSSCELG
ncbi:helix-turn-helix transcriptional regulator [Oceanobacillus sp. ISL-73]|nr:helix-turn-helix transcriptional regulator [Oceanobacillus sp. ISL-74]MBT2652293.1 helix-turn-helix transcriptional regulator [Oceanobacillus sp. ISL-73]